MSAVHQWYEIIAEEYSRTEELKAEYMERGEQIYNITDAFVKGEISQADYDDLIARVSGESETE